MENFGLDLEILESRVDPIQSLINTHEVLLVKARDLVNEVTRIRLELEKEKFKNFRLEQQINILNNVVMKSKLGSRKALLGINTGSTLETNNNVQVSTISENNGSQTKDTNSSASIPQLIQQSKSNNARSSQNHKSENMQIPVATNNFNQQLKDYQTKHDKLRLSHTPITSLRSRRYSRAQGGKLEIPPVQKLSILSSAHRAHGSAHILMCLL